MKKLLLVSNLVLMSIIWFQSCQNETPPPVIIKSGIDEVGNGSFQVTALDPTFSSCYGCQVDNIKGQKVTEFIDVVARYKRTHFDVVNAYAKGLLNNSAAIDNNQLLPNETKIGSDFKDSRSCWYSIDSLKKFICLMEKYSAELGLSSKELGVRLYYAVYEQDMERKKEFSSRHTLFLTPTYRRTDGKNEDFDPRYSVSNRNEFDGKPVPLSTILKKPSNSNLELFMYGGLQNMGNGSIMNQGDLCPPGTGCIPTLDEIDRQAPNGVPYMIGRGNSGTQQPPSRNGNQ